MCSPRQHPANVSSLHRLRAMLRSSPDISTLPYEAADRALLYCLRKKRKSLCNIFTVSIGVSRFLAAHSRTSTTARTKMRTRGLILRESSISSSAQTHSRCLGCLVDQRSSERVRKIVHGRDAWKRVWVVGAPRTSIRRSGGRRRP